MNSEFEETMLWERYKFYVDLYKFYFGTTLKINAFFLGVSGAILTYYFAHSTNENIHFSLMFPILVGVSLIALFTFGLFTIGALEQDIKTITSKMDLDVRVTISALYYLWAGSILMLVIASVACGYLFCNHT